MGRRKSAAEIVLEFWSRVEITDTCWNWTGAISHGYGTFRGGVNKTPAHRFSYEMLVGPIPDGLVIDHLCRNTRCVNPDHLEPVTDGINIRRGVGWSGRNARKTTCPKGHQNYGIDINGGRFCLTCRREFDRRRYSSRQAKLKATKWEIIPCACGCGKTRPKVRDRGRWKTYLPGHHGKRKNKSNGAQLEMAQ